MFKQIEYIKNVTVSAAPSGSNSWVHTINNMPTLPPDEVVIRSISYNTDAAGDYDGVYTVWSSLINDYIGAVSGAVGQGGTHNPQTRIILNGSFLGNTINFRLDTSGLANNTIPGDIVICMDFIRYGRKL